MFDSSMAATLATGRPRRATKWDMLIPKRQHREPVSSLLAEMRGPLPPEERRLLRTIAQAADVIAQNDGKVFLLVELNALDFERLSTFEAAAEDLEDETDRDDQGEQVDEDLDLAEGAPVPPDPAEPVFAFASLLSPTVLNEQRGGEHTIVKRLPQGMAQGNHIQEAEFCPNVFTYADAPPVDPAGREITFLPPIKYDRNGQAPGVAAVLGGRQYGAFDGAAALLTSMEA